MEENREKGREKLKVKERKLRKKERTGKNYFQ